MRTLNRWNPLSLGGVCGLLALLILSMGCETLDFTNPNSPEATSEISIQALVTGAEAQMREDLDVYIQAVSTIGREAYFFEPADPRFTTELIIGPVDPGGFLSTRPWFRRYQVIFNCNKLLDRAASLSGTQAAEVEGFARTIRGYMLLMILNYTDELGIRLNFDGDTSVPFATKTAAFDFIQNELNQGLTALNNAGSSFSFGLSNGFSGFDTPSSFAQFNRAIAARVAVYRGQFNEALTALGQSFLDPGGDFELGVYHVYSGALGDATSAVFEVPDAPGLKLHAHMSFEADAEPGDTRFSRKTFKRDAVDVNDNLSSDLAIVLHFGPGEASSFSPYPIIRNEELILLRAEANVGLGNFAAAEADLNIVRAAAGLAGYAGTDASNGLDRLLHEKRYSLFLEGHRWIDMRRYNKFSELPIDRPARGDQVLSNMAIPEDEFPEN
ncbi:RagB/SusD family nutrient uptake outer membrane protein [bacterium]|nr:RagB/SusD family nutrient uptake outer membrane protein [bacterium]